MRISLVKSVIPITVGLYRNKLYLWHSHPPPATTHVGLLIFLLKHSFGMSTVRQPRSLKRSKYLDRIYICNRPKWTGRGEWSVRVRESLKTAHAMTENKLSNTIRYKLYVYLSRPANKVANNPPATFHPFPVSKPLKNTPPPPPPHRIQFLFCIVDVSTRSNLPSRINK